MGCGSYSRSGVRLSCWLASTLLCGVVQAASYYTARLEDPNAVYLTRAEFGVHADGVGDDTAALQAAINRVVERTTRGILFIPEGRYRVTKTLTVWPGVRIIGYGRARPRIVLGERAPGFQGAAAYVVHFAGDIPGHPYNAGFVFRPTTPRPREIDFTLPVRDANPGTFYSALSNVDIEIQDGNPGAVAVRATYAQHCFLAHMDFHLGSALAGVHDGGNVGENLRFFGGQYGVITRTPSPGWQFTLIDVAFEGQRVASIHSRLSGLTLIRPRFRDTPIAVSMHPQLGEQLWLKDGRMENVSDAALLLGNENNPRNQINVENLVASATPVLARFYGSSKKVAAPAPVYRVGRFSHGLHLSGDGAALVDQAMETRTQMQSIAALGPAVASDLAPLPPQETWVNVRTLGVRGDGETDDTQALRAAIAKHRALYFPTGAYRISDTVLLRADTALIGLHAGATRIYLDDHTPAYQGVGPPRAMLETPRGGANIMIGFGVYTNGANPRALGVKWRSGAASLMHDVRFLGGHGTAQLSGEPEPIYNANKTADPDARRKWDSQYPSLWVTDGGGGVFLDIWTPSPYAQAGMLISHTETPGRIYQMSSEHHVRTEVKLDHVANWEIYALQLEEERGESGFALPVEIRHSRNVTFANLFTYRVITSSQPFPFAVSVHASRDIRFRNFHCWTNSKASFNSAVVDAANGLDVRQHEFAWLTLGDRPTAPAKGVASSMLEDGAQVRRLGSGFHQLAGGAVDPQGRFYAVDARWHRIYRWAHAASSPELISDHPLEPVNLATDASGHLLVVSHAGAVFALAYDDPREPIKALHPEPALERAGMRAVVPQNHWTNGLQVASGAAPRAYAHYVAPDRTTFLPVGEDFVAGKLSWGAKDHDALRAYGLTLATPGERAYFTLEWHGKTYSATLDAAGNWTEARLFAERGGEAVATDAAGNVYIAEGHVYVYDRHGVLKEVIQIPERPLGLVFGGEDGRTLYIPAGSSLYAVRTRVPGLMRWTSRQSQLLAPTSATVQR